MNQKKLVMQELVSKLNNASEAYYNSGSETMSNYEWDRMFQQLLLLEEETGIILPDSPTQKAGFIVMDKLPKVKHEFPALSLDKTKDVSVFPRIFNIRNHKAIVMWKMDGSTIQLTYDEGKLTTAATRGNGEVGQDITHNAKWIKGIPMEIPYKSHLIVRGEAVMSYPEFERINSKLPDGVDLYKNPRNLANSTIALLDNRVVAGREINFKAFTLVYRKDGMPVSFQERLQMMQSYGFGVVDYQIADAETELAQIIDIWTKAADKYEFPVDGLVVAADDAEYAEVQPGTGHNPNKLVGYALKWEDETAQTTLRNIEWSASRTGLLNPVAVFDPVELEGTTVTRASLHNVSYVLDMNLKIGDRISVYKANKSATRS